MNGLPIITPSIFSAQTVAALRRPRVTTFTQVKMHAVEFSGDEYAQARHDGRERTANDFPIAQQDE
jgi:hypothetical protein